jgi:hypothetical protein
MDVTLAGSLAGRRAVVFTRWWSLRGGSLRAAVVVARRRGAARQWGAAWTRCVRRGGAPRGGGWGVPQLEAAQGSTQYKHRVSAQKHDHRNSTL